MTAGSAGLRDQLVDSIESLAAETDFSGAVRVDLGADVLFERAYGLANRADAIANTRDTRFNIASGTKGLTALAVVSLIETGLLTLDTPARSILGRDLPLIDDAVTVEDLLAHHSGIGDYIDEDAIGDVTDYVLQVPAHELAMTEQYLRVLDGHAAKSRPRERFIYSNSGYVVLALIAERASGVTFHDLVAQRVCAPAELVDTAFLRLGRATPAHRHRLSRRRWASNERVPSPSRAAVATAASTRRPTTCSDCGARSSAGRFSRVRGSRR